MLQEVVADDEKYSAHHLGSGWFSLCLPALDWLIQQ
jgi:hypothetical protein